MQQWVFSLGPFRWWRHATVEDRRRCFLWGPFRWWRHTTIEESEAVFSLWSVYGLYNQGHQPASLVYRIGVSGESSAEELVDGQWEPVGSAGGPGPWINSAGVVTQLWESVLIVRRPGKYYSELWSCKSVYTVIVCNCVWSNKSSCQSNTHLI
jgi:hypothetical protein